MTTEEIFAEGQRLARPCVYLVDTPAPGDTVAAIWGGDGTVSPPDGLYKHWLTIDGSAFPAAVGTMPGILSLYTNEDYRKADAVVTAPYARLSTATGDGIALYARSALSLPPIDAIFMFGSAAVQDWLAENRWFPADSVTPYPYNSNFADRAIVDGYEKIWQAQLPLFTGGAHAVLGGWHIPWPDDDWHDLLEKTLIVWTFEDAEPWLEVWRDSNQGCSVLQRIT